MLIHLSDYPQLQVLAWHRKPDSLIEEADAFALYESNWRFVDEEQLTPRERRLIERLTRQFGNGVMNV